MTKPLPVCYLNGQFLPLTEAKISVLDRGFLFGDGVYEVIPVYAGFPFRLTQHLDRLQNSLRSIRLANPLTSRAWQWLFYQLINRNGGGNQSIYLHISRGEATERDHFFTADLQPTVFVMTSPLLPVDPAMAGRGLTAITRPDFRWQRCDIKATTLLANVLVRDDARQAGADEVILIRDGLLTEGAASNIFIVRDNVLITSVQDHRILAGITRDLVLELARSAGLSIEERDVSAVELSSADELLLSNSTRELMPIVRLDGVPVAQGVAGPIWQKLRSLWQDYKSQWVQQQQVQAQQ